MAYSASVPKFTCVVFQNGTNVTSSDTCNVNGTVCDIIEFDTSMRTIVSEWGLVCDRRWISQTITTIQMSGMLVGGIFWGHVCDGIGRKPTFFLNVLALGMANLISYFSVNWQMFASMRFIIGLGCAGFTTSPLMFEYIQNRWRVFLLLIPSFDLWASVMAAFCYWSRDWKMLNISIAVASGLAMFGWFYFVESFRWLVSNGKVHLAQETIRKVARVNRRPEPNLTKLSVVIEKEQKEAELTKSLRVYSALDLFRTRQIRKTTLLFAFIWLFSAYSYYGIALGVQELSGDFFLNLFLVNVIDIPGNYVAVLFNTWGGRKWTCTGFYALGGVFALLVGIFKFLNLSISGTALDALALSAKLCVSAAWNINTLWSQESFPTVVRFIGGGFISSVSRVGSMVAPQIITLSRDIKGLLYLVCGIVCLLSTGMCVFLDETKNRDLPDMIQRHQTRSDTRKNMKHAQKY
ncbi:solute carrier family 22 member 13-like [Dreissena polymorpha]|uniref:solute carrier family 22 member 13-like n=1 Tax=Dreissena polymorpha TaxID=45954 RepID=UPI002264F3FE|nr:solute carrier family 22 member 13-like [Dreissena polymorpha]